MNASLFPKLAVGGIKKNKRIYFPYMLTCIGMVMMYYIIGYLQNSKALENIPGASAIVSTMSFGCWVVAIFSCIFLFYTNSFLMRRRKKEFGLYNILGMGKRHIVRILVWESIITAIFSLVIGLLCGVGMSKLAELILINLMDGEITYSFDISLGSVFLTTSVFGSIFILIFLNSLRQIKFSSAVALLKSENTGEKPPKGNFILGFLGLGVLAAAYYIAITVADPVDAMGWFFIAVIMVIIGTYLIMIAGSVLFCRMLQKKKNYYYKPNHFVSVSSMVYRMKRNGAGLASICILATMVLVLVSTTTSLYFGVEDALNLRCPNDINVTLRSNNFEGENEKIISELRDKIISVADARSCKRTDIVDYRGVAAYSTIEGSNVKFTGVRDENNSSSVSLIYFVPIEDYNQTMGASESLSEEEVMLYAHGKKYSKETITFDGKKTFRVKKLADNFTKSGDLAVSVVPTLYVIVPNLDSSLDGIIKDGETYDGGIASNYWVYGFNSADCSEDEQLEIRDGILPFLRDLLDSDDDPGNGILSARIESKAAERQSFYSLYGTIFFLGIILSIVFIIAAVLIIYYKQISEGYEDASRFEIMQKVGMTKREIKRSINSQLLTVFFLPLMFAGVHLSFAFPLIRKILLLMNLQNVKLFAITTAVSFAVFALFYTVIYRMTSNAYYKIVSGATDRK